MNRRVLTSSHSALRLTSTVILTGLALTLAASTADAQAVLDGKHKRGAWYIGFGLGSGDATLEDSNNQLELSDDFEDATIISLNVKAGATVTDSFLVGGDISALSLQQSDGDVKLIIQLNSYDVVGTFFPLKEGFFVRGGAGLASLVISVEFGGISASDTYTGFDVLGGAGYALWIGDSFNLSANFDYHFQTYTDDNGPDTGNYWNAYLGFEWY